MRWLKFKILMGKIREKSLRSPKMVSKINYSYSCDEKIPEKIPKTLDPPQYLDLKILEGQIP